MPPKLEFITAESEVEFHGVYGVAPVRRRSRHNDELIFFVKRYLGDPDDVRTLLPTSRFLTCMPRALHRYCNLDGK